LPYLAPNPTGILKQLGNKLIALRCAGYNNVDLKAAAAMEILVVRVTAYFPYAIHHQLRGDRPNEAWSHVD